MEEKRMKKMTPAITMILAIMMILTMMTACADGNTAPAPTDPAAVSEAPVAPAETAEVDPVVGSWRMPPSPFGDDFEVFIVLNADGSFLNATNLFDSGNSGSYTQTVTTNEDFYWVKVNDTTVDLHYNYHDANGEFVTTLNYDPVGDKFYYGREVYAERDNTFVLVN